MAQQTTDDVTSIPVGGEHPYEVLVGADLTNRLPSILSGAAQVAVVHTGSVRETAERAAAGVRAGGAEVLAIEVPDAEAGKTIEVQIGGDSVGLSVSSSPQAPRCRSAATLGSSPRATSGSM